MRGTAGEHQAQALQALLCDLQRTGARAALGEPQARLSSHAGRARHSGSRDRKQRWCSPAG